MAEIKLAQPLLIMMLGYPGAGKSYFARQLAETLGAVHLSSDRIRFELFENPVYTKDETQTVFRLMDYMADLLLAAGQTVIYDAQMNRRLHRQQKRDLARKYKIASLIVWVQTDIDTALDRATNRDRRKTDEKYSPSLDPATFTKLQKELQRPVANEPYIVISGKHVFRTQLNSVVKKLRDIGLLDGSSPATLTTTNTQPIVTPRTRLGGRFDANRRRITLR